MKETVQILLATYNGEDFLQEQLDSIVAQTYTDWEILARDDESTDGTMEILRDFQKQHPGKITFVEDSDQNLGACGNFARLMKHSTANIVCFADQDDIWHPDKMEKSIRRLNDMEEKYGTDTPLLIHHDYSLIDKNGAMTVPSFEKENNTGKANSALEHILVQNIVYGFSSIANGALIEKALPMPRHVDMHDTHLGLVASTFGHIEYVPEQLAGYRIHENNVSGGNNPFYNFSVKDLISLSNVFNGNSAHQLTSVFKAAQAKLEKKCREAESFLEQYRDEMPAEKRELFENFLKLSNAGPLERKAIIVKNRFLPTSPAMAVAFVALG